jgi:hypothetical protein
MNIDKTKYKVWTWKHVVMLHWIINPGIALAELILGQRVPRILLIERDRSKQLAERSFVPCPHCNTIHSGLKWTPQNNTAFGNWFGYYCDNCGRIIPCLINLTSLIILSVTAPLWFWFRSEWKKKWLDKQKEKFSQPLNLTLPEYNWWYVGLRWGLFMYIMNALFFPLFDGTEHTLKRLLIGIPIWAAGGLLFGLTAKSMISAKKKKEQPAGQQ